jgi:hypothetical protein
MDIIPKVGIIVGIAAVLIMLPLMSLTLYNQLSNEFGAIFVDQDAILEEFKTFETYQLFKEKYPESYDDDRKYRNGDVRLEVQAWDFETGNRMELNIRYETYDDEIEQNVRCDINDRRYEERLGASPQFAMASNYPEPAPEPQSLPGAFLMQGHAEDEFVADFIKFTNCFEIGDENNDSTSHDHDESHSHDEPEPER